MKDHTGSTPVSFLVLPVAKVTGGDLTLLLALHARFLIPIPDQAFPEDLRL